MLKTDLFIFSVISLSSIACAASEIYSKEQEAAHIHYKVCGQAHGQEERLRQSSALAITREQTPSGWGLSPIWRQRYGNWPWDKLSWLSWLESSTNNTSIWGSIPIGAIHLRVGLNNPSGSLPAKNILWYWEIAGSSGSVREVPYVTSWTVMCSAIGSSDQNVSWKLVWNPQDTGLPASE